MLWTLRVDDARPYWFSSAASFGGLSSEEAVSTGCRRSEKMLCSLGGGGLMVTFFDVTDVLL